MSDIAACLSSKNMNFQTPPELLDIVRRMGDIDLDPATVKSNPVGAKVFYTPEEDGLKQPWFAPRRKVFFNPPYGRELPKFIQKADAEFLKSTKWDDYQQIALTPSRTDTKWFQNANFTAVCFFRGRIQFIDPDTGKPLLTWSKKQEKWINSKAAFPSAFIYWGYDKMLFAQVFSPYGKVYFND